MEHNWQIKFWFILMKLQLKMRDRSFEMCLMLLNIALPHNTKLFLLNVYFKVAAKYSC